MSGAIFTGKSADGSDAHTPEGVYDYGNGQWGNLPLPGEPQRTKLDRMIDRLAEHLVDSGRSIEEEYQLIEQKKSQLTKSMRDFVVVAYAMEKANNEHTSTDTEAKEEQMANEATGNVVGQDLSDTQTA